MFLLTEQTAAQGNSSDNVSTSTEPRSVFTRCKEETDAPWQCAARACFYGDRSSGADPISVKVFRKLLTGRTFNRKHSANRTEIIYQKRSPQYNLFIHFSYCTLKKCGKSNYNDLDFENQLDMVFKIPVITNHWARVPDYLRTIEIYGIEHCIVIITITWKSSTNIFLSILTLPLINMGCPPGISTV